MITANENGILIQKYTDTIEIRQHITDHVEILMNVRISEDGSCDLEISECSDGESSNTVDICVDKKFLINFVNFFSASAKELDKLINKELYDTNEYHG